LIKKSLYTPTDPAESEQNCSLGQINGALAPLTPVSLFASIGTEKLLNRVS
jgi:hypothetical protein